MAQLKTLEAKMANIEKSLSITPRRKEGNNIFNGTILSASHRNKAYYKELDSLRVTLRDKENIIQTLKSQLNNSLSNRLTLRNGIPKLTEEDKKNSAERLQRVKRDINNKMLAIKHFKFALDHLDITDNIDVRIKQAELEYRLGREELELLTLREESRALQATLELAETQERQRNDTIFSCLSGFVQKTVHAVEISVDPKSPRFGVGTRENVNGLYIDWAIEDTGLCKEDRILEVNGKLVLEATRSDLQRLLAVALDAAQIVVLRKNDSIAMLHTLRSENFQLMHRISYLEEQACENLVPMAEIKDRSTIKFPPNRQNQVQLSPAKQCNNEHSTLNYSSTESIIQSNSSTFECKLYQQSHLQPVKSTASLDPTEQYYQPLHYSSMLSSSNRRISRIDKQIQTPKNCKKFEQQQIIEPLDFDSEPIYSKLQECNTINDKNFLLAPKKPLRLSLHRAISLQSVESAPPTVSRTVTKNHCQNSDTSSNKLTKRNRPSSTTNLPVQSCQRTRRWPFSKCKSHIAQLPIGKWY